MGKITIDKSQFLEFSWLDDVPKIKGHQLEGNVLHCKGVTDLELETIIASYDFKNHLISRVADRIREEESRRVIEQFPSDPAKLWSKVVKAIVESVDNPSGPYMNKIRQIGDYMTNLKQARDAAIASLASRPISEIKDYDPVNGPNWPTSP